MEPRVHLIGSLVENSGIEEYVPYHTVKANRKLEDECKEMEKINLG